MDTQSISGQLQAIKISHSIGEYIIGNPGPATSTLKIDVNKNTAEPRLCYDEFMACKLEIEHKAFQVILEFDKLLRLNPVDFRTFSETYYGSTFPALKRGTGVCSTTLLMLDSIHKDVSYLREQYCESAENILNCARNTIAIRNAALFCNPLLLFLDSSIRPVEYETGMSADILRYALRTSGGKYWYNPENDIAVVSWDMLKKMIGSNEDYGYGMCASTFSFGLI